MLVKAALNAGALAFLAAGYKSAEDMSAEVQAVKAATDEPFGVNVFAPGTPTAHDAALGDYVRSLSKDAARVDVALGEATWDDDDWNAKLAALLNDPPAVVSFTFGCPSSRVVADLHQRRCVVLVTVTSPDEARRAAQADVDGLCAQGIEAGAHRASFVDDGAGEGLGVLELVRAIAQVTSLPQIAAGGVMSSYDVRRALDAGALAVQCGTAFLRCPESGASDAHKAALVDPRFTTTALTRSFSGRSARGLVNQFMTDHPDAPSAYPEINNATRPLRLAASNVGDLDRMSLWAGVGFASATSLPVAQVVRRLSA